MFAHPRNGLISAMIVNSERKMIISEEIVVEGESLYFGAYTFKQAKALASSIASIAAAIVIFVY